MRKLIIFLLALNLYATDIVTEYRLNGLADIEKKLDKALTEKSYWKKYLKNKDTSFGYIENYTDILVCDKSKSNLTLYKKGKQKYEKQVTYGAYTGKLKGDKKTEGDLKTPNGIYNLVKKIDKLDSFYGPMAFVTSYPNDYDKYLGKSGHGIWIHGLPTQQKRDTFTKGCIAINNDHIKCLDRDIDLSKTLLLIYPKKYKLGVSKKELTNILSQLYMWRYAWIYNDLETYLSFYDKKNFKRADGKNFKWFKRHKTRIFNKNETKQILFNNITVIPYPNKKGVYQIVFNESFQSDTYEFNGDKILMIKLKNNTIQIFMEK